MPMHPALLAATDHHWCNAAIALQLVGGRISIALRADSCDQPRSQLRSGSLKGIRQGIVGTVTRQTINLLLIALDGLQEGREQAGPRDHGRTAGPDDRLVVSRRHSLSDLLEPLANAL